MAGMKTYEVRMQGDDNAVWHISARSRSAARYEVWSAVRDVLNLQTSELPFGAFTVRSVDIRAGKDPYEYVRRVYNVPAKVGGLVEYDGQRCTIVRPGTSNCSVYVHVATGDGKLPYALHPKETGLTYLEETLDAS